MYSDRRRVTERCDGDDSIEYAITNEFEALVGGCRAVMRRMCDCFEQQGWELENVSNHCLKRLMGWRKRYLNIVSSMESLTKLIQRRPR